MTAPLRRGACPSLTTPMPTGDGLLVRISPPDRFSAKQLIGLARAAKKFGNGILEITARGNLQMRGLTDKSVQALAEEMTALAILLRSGVPILTGPLAGLDASEIADPRGLARDIEQRCAALGLSSRLNPKVSVIVDGGGLAPLSALGADVKLEARAVNDGLVWLISVGGGSSTARVLGSYNSVEALEITIRLLEAVARKGQAARARDLDAAALASFADSEKMEVQERSAQPRALVGRFSLVGGLTARGFCAAYGQIASDALMALAEAGGAHEIRLAPGGGLIILPLTQDVERALVETARHIGLITLADDPRLAIKTCAGAPACTSGHLATRMLADALVAHRSELLDDTFTLHISGCSKACARPNGPSVTLEGENGGYRILGEGVGVPRQLQRALAELAETHLISQRRCSA